MKIPAITLALFAAVSLQAATPPTRVLITQAQVAAAILDAGVNVTADQVALLADVFASTATPALRVESMQPFQDHRMKVRLACETSQCLPFFVTISTGPRADAHGDAGRLQQPLPAAHLERVALLESVDATKNIAVHSGSAATLLIESEHVHIRMSVICLENGAPGQVIRVSSKDHRQTYTAQVGNDAVLRASL